MNKVYVVTAGDYSAYHIVGVFTDKALAEKYVERYNAAGGWDSAQIEEFEPDVIINRKYLYSTYIYQNYQTKPQEITRYIEYEQYPDGYEFKSGRSKDIFAKKDTAQGYGDTPEESQKIARDIWAQIQAEEAGL